MGHSSSKPIPELPPEVVLNILELVPRPRFIALGFLAQRSSLTETALVNKAWAGLSQRVLFQEVGLFNQRMIRVWSATAARRWTRSLLVRVHNPDDVKDPFAWPLRVGLGRVQLAEEEGAREGTGLRVLQIEVLSGGAKLQDEFYSAEGLSDLDSFKLEPIPFPSIIPSSAFASLRHLKIRHFTPTPAGTLPFLPSVTHLSCHSAFGPHLDNLATAFPDLTYLYSAELWTASADPPSASVVCEALPARLTEFGTAAPISAEVCAALPARLVKLTARLKLRGSECAAIRDHWFNPGHEGPRPHLLIVFRKRDLDGVDDRAPLAALRELIMVGCGLEICELKEWDDRAWRGLKPARAKPIAPDDWPRAYQTGLSYQITRLGFWAFGDRALEAMGG